MTQLTSADLVGDLAVLITQTGLPVSSAELAADLDTSYPDIGLDSLGHLELMIGLGTRFGIRISDADAALLRTPSETLAYLAAALVAES
jgi:acyl carrier protein